MNDAFYVASTGMGAQDSALRGVANNIANVNTQGYKRSDVRFAEVLSAEQINQAGASQSPRSQTAGVMAQPSFSMMDQGALEQTGNAFDIAIEGNGFIELMGPGGASYLWRGGRTRVNQDGFLAADNGMMLRAMINVPEDATQLNISENGEVSVLIPGDEAPLDIGLITLVQPPQSSEYNRMNGGFYKVDQGVSLAERDAGENGFGVLVQGSVERSNVDLNREMIQMMVVQRAYTSNAQVVQAADQLLAIANNLRQ